MYAFFSDQIVPALNALSSVAENSSSGLAVPADFHPVAIAVYLLPYSYLIWGHGSSSLGVVRHYLDSATAADSRIVFVSPPGWTC